jgi:hypothetical protein
VFDYISPDGPQREQFTLEDDGPIGRQVQRILSELRRRDVVLSGGRDEVLSIEWNGTLLDEAKSPRALGISPARPIELRMRPRPEQSIRIRAGARTAAPRSSFVPVGIISMAIAGALGAACAWTALAVMSNSADTAQDRDAMAVLMLLGGVGLFTVLVQHGIARRLWVGLLGVIVGAPLTAAISVGLVGALLDGDISFLDQRLALFACVGALSAMTLSLTAPTFESGWAVLESGGWGTVAGVVAAILMSLESLGVSSALAWPLLGAGIGAGAEWPRLRRAAGICELLPEHRGILAALSMRSFPVRDLVAQLEGGARIERVGNQVLCDAPGGLSIGGIKTMGPAPVVNGDYVRAAGRLYRYRERPR